MTRYNPTPAQKEAAKERRDKIRELTKRLTAMTDTERAAITRGLAVTIEGHTLSPTNQMLIAYQSIGQQPATVVGGFQQWRKAGRCVAKGQHGYAIWVPIGKKDKPGDEPASTSKPASTDERTGFMLATVFDITQTQAHEATQ